MRTLSLSLAIGTAALVALMGLVARGGDGEPASGATVEFQLTDAEIPIQSLLQAVVEATDLHLMWDPKNREIRGGSIPGPVAIHISRADLMGWLRSVLIPHDLVIVPLGPRSADRWYVADARATTAVLRLRPRYVQVTDRNVDELESQDGVYVTTTFLLHHVTELHSLRNALQRIVTPQNIGSAQEVPAANSIIVTDFAPNVAAIYRLVQALDVPDAARAAADDDPRTLHTLRLANADAVKTASILVPLIGANRPRAWERPVPKDAPIEKSPEDEGPRIYAQPRLNQLIVSATAAEFERIRPLVGAMDAPSPDVAVPETTVEVIRLENARAEDVAMALGNLLASSRSAWAREAGIVPSVVPFAATDAVLVQGSADAVARLRRLVAELDRPRPTARSEGGG